MTSYDPAILQSFADQLYRRARGIEIKYAAGGGLLGLLAGLLGGGYLSMLAEGASFTIWGTGLVFLAVGGVFGFSRGRMKAFTLRLQAQQALCYKKIEENTRVPPDESTTEAAA